MAGWTFRPPLWAVVGTIAGCALTSHLGFWQLHRGRDREALDAQYSAALSQAPVELGVDTPTPPHATAVFAAASGRYSNHQLLLDNQVHDRIPGYHVLTPLLLEDGHVILVNRGWVPQNPDRRILPDVPIPDREVRISGLWRSLPEPALRLRVDNCSGNEWPRIVEYPDVADLGCLYPEGAAHGVLLMSPDAPDGYLRNWSQSDGSFPPSRNYAYAAQWFMFAVTLFVLFIKLNLKKRS